MYTNIGTDVVHLGPTDDYDKLQEEGSTHLSPELLYTSFISTDNSLWVVGIEYDNVVIKQLLSNWFTVKYITPELLGLTEYFDKGESKLYIYASTMTFYRTKTYVFHVDTHTMAVERGRYDWTVINANKGVVFPGVGKVVPDWQGYTQHPNQFLTKTKIDCDFPAPTSAATVGLYGLSRKDEVWNILPGTFDLFDTMTFPIIGTMFNLDPAGLLESFANSLLAKLKWSMTQAIYSGTTQVFPIKLDCIRHRLRVTGEDWLHEFTPILLRPLVHIYNIGLLYSIPHVPMYWYSYSLGYTSLIAAMTDMAIADIFYSTNHQIQVLYAFAPTNINTSYANPARQETDLSSAHADFFHFIETPTTPFVNVIAGKNETFILYAGSQQLVDYQLWPWSEYDTESKADCTRLLYTRTVQPEDYGIFEGLVFGRTCFHDFKSNKMTAAQHSVVVLGTFDVEITPKGSIQRSWDYGDLTRYAADLYWAHHNSDCCDFDGTNMSDHAVVGKMTPTGSVLTLNPSNNSFLFSLSSTPVLSDLDTAIECLIKEQLQTNKYNTTVTIPVFMIANVYLDWLQGRINFIPQSLSDVPLDYPYFLISEDPVSNTIFNGYNMGRVEAYPAFYNFPAEYVMYLLTYSASIDLSCFSSTLQLIREQGGQLVSVTGSIFTKEGLSIKVTTRDGIEVLKLTLSDQVTVRTSNLQVLWQHRFINYGSFSKVYFDPLTRCVYSHTSDSLVEFDLNTKHVKLYPLTRLVTSMRTISNFKNFVKVVIPHLDKLQRTTSTRACKNRIVEIQPVQYSYLEPLQSTLEDLYGNLSSLLC